MKTRTRGPWLFMMLFFLAVSAAVFFGGEKKAEAVTGEWGIINHVYAYEYCAYGVFVRNELDVSINAVAVRVRFVDSAGLPLGTYNLAGKANIPPWTTDVLAWKINEICSNVYDAKIIKSVAAY